MVVNEEFQILAHDEEMEQLFVDDLETHHWPVLPRIMNEELKSDRLVGFDGARRGRQIHVIFHALGDAGSQLHAAARAYARLVGSDIWIHWTDPDRLLA